MKKLLLGCGNRKKIGWINLDINPKVNPDIVSNASDLKNIPGNSIDLIDSYHLFEHFFPHEATQALKEWYRVLKKGGELYIEFPNLERCAKIILESKDPEEIRLAMIGIYGYQPDIFPKSKSDPPIVFQMHKFGWTPRLLSEELKSIGFSSIEFIEPVQKNRRAYQIKRDMRVKAIK